MDQDPKETPRAFVVDSTLPGAERLGDFIADFLVPIAADGSLEAWEETPLLLAYHIYGVAEAQTAAETGGGEQTARLVETFKRAIRGARQGDPWRWSAAALTRAQARARARSRARLSVGDAKKLDDWFRRQAELSELSPEILAPPAGSAVLTPRPFDRVLLARFRRWFEELREADAEPAPTAEEPEPETESAPVNAVEPRTPEPPAAVEAALPPAPAGIVTHPAEEVAWRGVVEGRTQDALRERAGEILGRARDLLDGDGVLNMAFGPARADAEDMAVVLRPEELKAHENLWFIGDLHSDLLALECALALTERHEAASPPTLVFLGDLIDDGAQDYEVMLRVLDLLCAAPDRVCLVAGNHDEALRCDGGVFTSDVSPSDFDDWLNEHHEDGDAAKREIGPLVIELFRRVPRALFFPDGLLAVHGGIPQSDIWPRLSSHGDLNDPLCLQDFVWTRAHERAKKRCPNRCSRSAEFGRQDFEGFCELTRFLPAPVERMIRGHDHFDERYCLYDKYEKNRVLAINTLSRRLPREWRGPLERSPCVARWVPGQVPEVHRIEIPAEAIRAIYGAEESPEPAG